VQLSRDKVTFDQEFECNLIEDRKMLSIPRWLDTIDLDIIALRYQRFFFPLVSSALTDVNGCHATYRHAIRRSRTHREAELRMIACSQGNPILLADQSLAISFISTTDCGVENDRL